MNDGLLYKAQVRWLFHAHIKIKIPVFCDESLFDELFAVLEDVDKHYNSYSEGSFFDLINKNAGQFVEVDEETISLLKQLIYFSDLFDGQYDITIMPLVRLWGFYKDESPHLPLKEEIKAIKKLVNYKKIEIEGSRVRIAEGQEIITGSFMKSYAVDKLVQKMRKEGITNAIINAGGSTIKALNNSVHPYWVINVENSLNKEDTLFKLKLSNTCFSTSAQTKTFVEIGGKKYGHIINPSTGYPSENKQIGILSTNCFVGDIISTGLYNQTLDGFTEKMKLLSRQFDVSGFLMDKNNNIRFSDDFEKYIVQ